MLPFENDYSYGACPQIIDRLAATNGTAYPGYGSDGLCERAKSRIKAACNAPDADVWFLVGGTQTNQTVIDSVLPQYAGVITVQSGHPNVHEAGAIEATGHKVITLPQHDGKLDQADLASYCEAFYADDNHEHMVFPGMVYISHPTEYGTIYTKAELEAIAGVSHRYGMPLYVDGARLGYGLTATGTDVTLADLSRIVDMLYIGGTKVGALFGEAVVFMNRDELSHTPKHFLTLIKRHGALLAKGWLLGLQFDTLFEDGLYLRIARRANETADRIRAALRERGYTLTFEAPTNQIFITVDAQTRARLERHVRLGFMEKADDTHVVMRICTSWNTTDEQVEELISLL